MKNLNKIILLCALVMIAGCEEDKGSIRVCNAMHESPIIAKVALNAKELHTPHLPFKILYQDEVVFNSCDLTSVSVSGQLQNKNSELNIYGLEAATDSFEAHIATRPEDLELTIEYVRSCADPVVVSAETQIVPIGTTDEILYNCGSEPKNYVQAVFSLDLELMGTGQGH